MNIVVDENIPLRTVAALRAMGHTIHDVRGSQAQGQSDDNFFLQSVRLRALLITTDKGFKQRYSQPHFGILVIRLRQPNGFRIHTRVLEAVSKFKEAEWPGLLVEMRDRVQSVLRTHPE